MVSVHSFCIVTLIEAVVLTVNYLESLCEILFCTEV